MNHLEELLAENARLKGRVDDLSALVAESHTDRERLRDALAPFAHFMRMFNAKPVGAMRGQPLPDDHPIYSIHTGTKWAAEITLGALRAALAAVNEPTP